MAITISGGKYANNTIASVGTATTVTASTANFVSTDFTVQRVVGMWNSAGTTFLGMAFVRAFVSTSQLQLETAFFDPATGLAVAQTAGNIIIVSKNFADSVTTNLAVSNGVVTASDTLVFGSTTATSVCFYDQAVDIVSSYVSPSGGGTPVGITGGLVVFGKLENFASNIISNPVNIYLTAAISSGGATYNLGGVDALGNGCNFAMYGGQISNVTGYPCFSGGNSNFVPYTWVMNGVQLGVTMISPSSGGSWGANQTRIQVLNCFSEFTLGSTCARLWGDGIQLGGSFKFPYNTGAPYGCFGNYGVSGNYFFAGVPGQRTVALDLGSVSFLAWVGQGTPATWYVTNFIASTYNFGPGSSSGFVLNQYFQDTFTFATPSWLNVNTTALTSSATSSVGPICSILSGTAAIVAGNSFAVGQAVQFSATVGTSGGQVVAGTTYYVVAASSSQFQVSATLNGTAITFNASGVATAINAATALSSSPALLYQTISNQTQTTAPPAAWYWGVKAYGRQAVSGTITPTTYATLSGNGPQVSFGQSVIQATDSGVGSVTQAIANAYTSIANLDQLYAACINWATLSQANAAYPSISAYPMTYSGSVLNLGSLNLVLATTGAAFSINTSTNTVTINATTLATGSIFTSFTTTGTVTLGTSAITCAYTSSAGTQGILTLTNLVAGSAIYIATSGGVQLGYVGSSGTSYTITIPPNTGANYTWKVAQYGYLPASGTFNPQAVSSATVIQNADSGITQATVATVAAYTSLASPDQIYDYAAYWETTTAGIASTRATTKNGTQLSFGANAVVLNASASPAYSISGATVTIKAAATLANGTTYSSGFATTSTLTLTGVAVACVYTTSAGTSLAVRLATPIGSSVAITNGSGAQAQFTAGAANTTGVVTYYAAPGQTGTWAYKVTQYGSIGASATFAPSGQVTATIALATDAGITQSTQATVAAYTSLASLDQFYDYAAYFQTTSTGIAFASPDVKLGPVLSLGADNLVLASGTNAAPLSISGSTVTIYTGTALGSGVTFTSLSTTGTVTVNSGTAANILYTSGAGTSLVLALSNIVAASQLCIINNSGASNTYVASTGTSYTFYLPPGSTGTWTWRIAKYGYLAASATFSPTGSQAVVVAQSTDSGITQATQSTVAAYASLTSLDQLYDFAASYQTTTAGILFANPLVKQSTAISIGADNLTTVTGTSAAPYAVAGSTITIYVGSGITTGVTFTSLVTTGTVTAGTSAPVNLLYTSSAGTSLVLAVSNIIAGSQLVCITNSGASNSYIASTGTSLTIYLAPGATGTWTWRLAKYGYIAQSATFTPSGAQAVVVAQSVDSGITQPTVATVAAYTSLTTLDQLYDYAAYYQTTTSGILIANPLVKQSTAISIGADSLTTVAGTSATPYAVSGSAITIYVGAAILTGSTFTSLVTSGAVTAGTGAPVNLLYTSSAGTSGVVNFTGVVTGSRLYIANGSGVQQYNAALGATSFSQYIPAATAATWSYAIALYGKLPVTGSVSSSGLTNIAVAQSTDTGITQATAATVAAYPSITSLDQLYDYAAYYQTTAGGIIFARIATKNGAQVSLGANSLTVNSGASALWSYVGTALTVLGTTLNSGVTFTSLATSAGVTFSGSATNNAIYTSSAGTSAQLVLTGVVAGSYVYVQNASGTQFAYLTGQAGTVTVNVPPGAAAGTWTWSTKALGYSHVAGSFVPSSGGITTAAATGVLKQAPDGSTSYQGTTSSLVTVSFAGTSEAALLIGNGAISAQNAFDASEQALVTAAGMAWLASGLGELSLYLSFAGSFLFLTTKWRIKALSAAASANASVLAYPISADGTPIDSANGSVVVGVATSGSSLTASAIAAAVWAYTNAGNGQSADANLSAAGSNAPLIPALL